MEGEHGTVGQVLLSDGSSCHMLRFYPAETHEDVLVICIQQGTGLYVLHDGQGGDRELPGLGKGDGLWVLQ